MMRTGVIVGVSRDAKIEQCALIREHLEAHFPGVVFAIVSNVSSVAFTFEDDGPRTESERA